jgi:hypothetical protein
VLWIFINIQEWYQSLNSKVFRSKPAWNMRKQLQI